MVSCNKKQDELRLRILASSNSIEDQEIKLEVKDYLEVYLLDKNVNSLDLILLEKELTNKFNINIKVTREYVLYEAKSYKGKIIPSGRYETILITIEEGLGKNFWTLLYPEFFNISFEDNNEIEYRSYFYDLFSN